MTGRLLAAAVRPQPDRVGIEPFDLATPDAGDAPRARTLPPLRPFLTAIVAAASLYLAGCAQTGSQLLPPAAADGSTFKQAPPGWLDAVPADLLERGPWWSLFQDPALDALAVRVEVTNPGVAVAVAAVAQAGAVVRQQQALRRPTLGVSGSVSRSGGGGSSNSVSDAGSRYAVGLQAGWEPDLWGRIAGSVTAAGARADASEADLAAARLSAQAELATAYFDLRLTDAEIALLRNTLTAYERAARITGNRYDAGVTARTDLLQAQTQVANTRSTLAALQLQRAQLEHAIAVLVGEAPSQLNLPAADWSPPALPALPGTLPSTLLQRRPDIAAAERRVASANASIGVARAAWFPSFGLSGDLAQGSRRIADLFASSVFTWSLGVSVLQTLFDGGARSAQLDAARADWEVTVAQYRQTVLTAFQEVEDRLAGQRWLAEQSGFAAQAAQAAGLAEEQAQNRYDAGLVSYTEVVQAQVTALNARRAQLQLTGSRLATQVALVRALGGGFVAR